MDSTKKLSRKALQPHFDAAVDGVIRELGVPLDTKNSGRVVRCLVRKAVQEIAAHLPSNLPQQYAMEAIAEMLTNALEDAFEDGEVSLGAPPVTIEGTAEVSALN